MKGASGAGEKWYVKSSPQSLRPVVAGTSPVGPAGQPFGPQPPPRRGPPAASASTPGVWCASACEGRGRGGKGRARVGRPRPATGRLSRKPGWWSPTSFTAGTLGGSVVRKSASWAGQPQRNGPDGDPLALFCGLSSALKRRLPSAGVSVRRVPLWLPGEVPHQDGVGGESQHRGGGWWAGGWTWDVYPSRSSGSSTCRRCGVRRTSPFPGPTRWSGAWGKVWDPPSPPAPSPRDESTLSARAFCSLPDDTPSRFAS